ncbi:MAG: DUF2892 domain-containing protein [Verrucomicrobiales bacterium]|jgi:uncharacterized membrane protein|nr:DUF2892 domain-containing protein [Verrucomicrobiales bacterium]
MENNPSPPTDGQKELNLPHSHGKSPSIHLSSNTQNNFQINLPPEVSLPPAEEFNKYSPDVRAFLLEGARTEQQARHGWIAKEQSMRAEDWKGQRVGKIISMLLGALLSIAAILCGTLLLLNDKPISGWLWALIGVAWLVASAVYGFRPPALSNSDAEKNQN